MSCSGNGVAGDICAAAVTTRWAMRLRARANVWLPDSPVFAAAVVGVHFALHTRERLLLRVISKCRLNAPTSAPTDDLGQRGDAVGGQQSGALIDAFAIAGG